MSAKEYIRLVFSLKKEVGKLLFGGLFEASRGLLDFPQHPSFIVSVFVDEVYEGAANDDTVCPRFDNTFDVFWLGYAEPDGKRNLTIGKWQHPFDETDS